MPSATEVVVTWVPKYLYFNLTAIHLFNASHEFETYDLRVNLLTCGEFYSLVFSNLLRVNVSTSKKFYRPLFGNLDETILLIALVITAFKNPKKQFKDWKVCPQDLVSVDIVLVHPYLAQAYSFTGTLALQLLGLPGSQLRCQPSEHFKSIYDCRQSSMKVHIALWMGCISSLMTLCAHIVSRPKTSFELPNVFWVHVA